MIGGSLDRAMDVAATLEVRGFAGARRAPRSPRPWSRHDFAFLASAVAIARARRARQAHLAPRASPPIRKSTGAPTAGTAALCLGLALAVLLPFADRRGIER